VKLLLQIALVAMGSSIGGLARWGVSLAAGRILGTAFPWGTLFINVSGSLFLGWFTTILETRLFGNANWRWLRPDDLRLMIAVGFTGAYTTFSTFEYESYKMIDDRDYLATAAYVAGSVFLGLLAVRAGTALAK
jgi:CrcB protein